MATYKRTITTTMNPDDAVAAANQVAEALRADGAAVDVGPVYDNVTVKWYGMPSVDITVTTADAPSEEQAPTETAAEAPPEPMPFAELGGTSVAEAPKESMASEASPASSASSPEPVPSSAPVLAGPSPEAPTDTSGTSPTTETEPLASSPASTGPDTSTTPSTEPPSSTTSSETPSEESPKGPLPDGFPGLAALADAGITTYARLRKTLEKTGDLTQLKGIGKVTAAKITDALGLPSDESSESEDTEGTP
jgi:hypothetical protein